MEMKYEISGKSYIQKPLVLLQIIQLLEVLRDTTLVEPPTVENIIASLGDRLPQLLAILLTAEGESLKSKDLLTLADELEYSVEAEMVFEIIADFFICNQVKLVMMKFAGMIIKVREALGYGTKQNISELTEELLSVGDSLSESALDLSPQSA